MGAQQQKEEEVKKPPPQKAKKQSKDPFNIPSFANMGGLGMDLDDSDDDDFFVTDSNGCKSSVNQKTKVENGIKKSIITRTTID